MTAQMTATHPCPGPGCRDECQFGILACPRHWAQVPKGIQRAVTRAWAHGAGFGTPAHTAARAAAVARMRPL